MTPDMNAKVQLWRQKARDGTLTQEEMREALTALRADRTNSHTNSGASRAKRTTAKAKANINSEDLLSELDGL